MTTFEPTEQARAAAVRAAVLAGIARRRTLFASAWDGRALHVIADLLDTVALSLYEEEPTGLDGMPDGASLALAAAEVAAAQAPGTGFPADFGQYITHALDCRRLWTPAPLDFTACTLADDDAHLVAALDTLHGHLASAATEHVAQALLEAVFALHDKRADLAQLARG
ncbi:MULTISPECIES: hypothetical protein [Streptomyces]|uniref:hypothetical protein n=1 Tax=Streptomyces TaxID=1883 RepID=UPI00073DE8F5|nr:hypothetical protein [Streptomyces sp. FBKL.4005]OYP10247.1 hypothetical protein CFC35_41375 [Streptomyces sp. FBKL.4005]CUW33434.1 hypothetical protein TUE45_pSRTUE45a_0066 [Streptomyces reticuli]